MYNILSKRINIQDYSDLNEEDETSDSANRSNVTLGSERNTDSEDQEYEEQQHEPSKLSSDEVLNDLEGIQFSGMRVFDTIRPKLAKSNFEVEINHKGKYIHKKDR